MPITKQFLKSKPECKVTFVLTADEVGQAENVALVGDFNDWNHEACPMKKQKDGGFKANVTLPLGASYKFRYVADGQRWINDPAADGYAHCAFAEEDNSLLNLHMHL